MTSGADEAVAAHELDLVTRAAQGDEAAFDQFFERHAAAVQLLIERLLGPGPAADAVVIEAFEKTVRRLPLLGARNSSPGLYTLSTARNGAYAALGRARPTATDGPLAALLSLPSRQRELLALRELGLDEAHCAEVAGIDPGDVGPQLARGRLRLTDALEGTTLSTVVADLRAEQLLAAEVTRPEGAALPAGLEAEIVARADADETFAAALAAVRAPARSLALLPPASGAGRLAPTARSGSVGVAPALRAAAPAAVAAGGAAAAAAATARAATPASPDAPSTARNDDAFDDAIGDELAWGIVDDGEDDHGRAEHDARRPAPTPTPSSTPARPADEPPADAWSASTTAFANEPPTELVPHGAAPGSGSTAVPNLGDPFEDWDDALDWEDDEKLWETAPATVVAAAGVPDLGETRPFDAVAAGLADPVAAPTRAAAVTEHDLFDKSDRAPSPVDEAFAEEPPARRRRLAWLPWLIGAALLFVGVAFAANVIYTARQSPERPAESVLDPTTSTTGNDAKQTTPATKKQSSGSSSSKSSTKKTTSSTATGDTPASSGSGTSTGTSSGTTSGGTTSGGTTSGGTSTGGTTSSSGGTTTTKSSSTAATPTVAGGESSSGGSVRGSTDAATTTP